MGSPKLPDTIVAGNKLFMAGVDEIFVSFSQIVLKQKNSTVHTNGNVLQLELVASALSKDEMNRAVVNQPEIILVLYRNNKQQPILIPTGKKITNGNGAPIEISIQVPELKEKKYAARWGLQGSYPEPSINSSVFTLVSQKR